MSGCCGWDRPKPTTNHFELKISHLQCGNSPQHKFEAASKHGQHGPGFQEVHNFSETIEDVFSFQSCGLELCAFDLNHVVRPRKVQIRVWHLGKPCLVVDDCNAINPLRQQGPLGAKAGIQSTVQQYRILRFECGIKRMVEHPCKHFWV